MLGLTHPAINAKWFGLWKGGHFFRYADGDRYVAVLRERDAAHLVDAISVDEQAMSCDPRPVLRKVADEWATRRGWVRRGR